MFRVAGISSSWTLKKVLGRAALVGGVLVGATAAIVTFDEGSKRSLKFWSQAFPIYAHYRLTQFRFGEASQDEKDRAYNELHDRYAPIAEKIALELKGMYLKNAQILSTRDEFVPPQYMEFCKRMQDKVPTEFVPGQVRTIVESELGKSLEDVFEEWDDRPLGAASIGEAHYARLKGGKDVVVKVMYPGIEKKFRSDLQTMKKFCELAMPHHVPALDEMEKQFLTEFDYLGEARNMQEIHDNIMPVFGDSVVIPQPVMDLCTRQVLVMDMIPGIRLIDGIRAMYEEHAKRLGKTLEELEREQKELMKAGKIRRHTLEEEHKKAKMMQRFAFLGDTINNTGRFLYNHSAGLMTGKTKEYKWMSAKVPDLGHVMELLLQVHAHEMLIDGAFNGDPHPGNILLCPDGRLGLIDYGQVKRVDLQTRIHYAKIICALADGNRNEAIRLYREAGFKSKKNDDEILWRLLQFWNDRDDESVVGDHNIQTFMDWAEAQDPVVAVPQEYVMFCRVSILLRGMGNAFGLQMRVAPYWRQTADKLLQQVQQQQQQSSTQTSQGIAQVA